MSEIAIERTNHQRIRRSHPSLNRLSSLGHTVERVDEHHYCIAGRILFWPATDYWRTSDCAGRGYGLRGLVATLALTAPEVPA